jgi:hypothetical protein
MGAIGMLVEQGGIGAGRAVETEDGFILTFRQRIYDHYTTSLATIRKAAERRRELLAYSLRAWDPANSLSDNKAYFIRQDDGGYVEDVIRILLHQGVDVQRATADFTVRDARNYWDGERQAVNLSAGDYIISADQPRHLFVHSLLQRNMAIEDSVMYDMATWSAPIAYNLEAYSSRQTATFPAEPVGMDDVNWRAGISLVETPYAYVIDWDQRWAPRALSMLWAKGYRVRAALEPFSHGEHSFSAGSLIILRGRNLDKAEEMTADMAEIAEGAGVRIVAKATGRMLEGYDLA